MYRVGIAISKLAILALTFHFVMRQLYTRKLRIEPHSRRTPMSNAKGKRWAVLIGVDYYIPGNARPGMKFHNLRGCVEDVDRIEEYLRTTSDIQPHCIFRLTATAPKADSRQHKPQEAPSNWPTYENIIDVLQEVTGKAEPNDLIYIHYSGHGARARTIFRHLKRSGGDLDEKQNALNKAIARGDNETHYALDEALVPTDIACDGGRYLRDVEIACLLSRMTEKKLVVTIVLDSCHSGGGVRSKHEAMARGIQKVDMNQLVSDTSVLPQEELSAAYRRSVKDDKRAGEVPKHWLLESHGYAFLAACHADEFAQECVIDGKVQGLFTHCLIDTLNSGSHITYHDLHRIVSRKVRENNSKQKVVLGGEGNRLFFDWGESQLFHAAIVIEVHEMNAGNVQAIVRLKAGNVHGVSKGAVFDVWPKSCSNFDESTRLARLSVTMVEAFTSEAESIDFFRPGHIEAGCLALPLPQKRVKFVETSAPSHEREALRKAREATCERYGHTILKKPRDQNVKEDFRVEVKDGHYVMLGADGQHLRHTIPPLRIDSQAASEKLVRRLTHIAKYYTVQDLKLHNHADESSWANEFSVDLGKMPNGSEARPRRWHSKTGPPRTMPVKWLDKGARDGNICEVADGSWVFLRVENKAEHAVHIAVLNLESSWAIKQIYPGRPGTTHETLGPHAVLDLPLHMTIPKLETADGSARAGLLDSFMVFVTDEPASFRWLELPPLDVGRRNGHGQQPEKRAGAPREETVMKGWTAKEWTAVEVRIRTTK